MRPAASPRPERTTPAPQERRRRDQRGRRQRRRNGVAATREDDASAAGTASLRRYALIAVVGVSVIWILIAPHDVPASTAKLKASLGNAKSAAPRRGSGRAPSRGSAAPRGGKSRSYAPHNVL